MKSSTSKIIPFRLPLFQVALYIVTSVTSLSHNPGEIRSSPKMLGSKQCREVSNLAFWGAAFATLALKPAAADQSISMTNVGCFKAMKTLDAMLPLPSSLLNAKEEFKEKNTFVNGLISGAASRISKEIVLHPIDTLRARLAAPPEMRNESVLFSDLYSGLAPALIGGIPAGVKDFCKKQFRTMGFSKEQSTILVVTAANIPFWVIRTPTETLKTKQQVGEASLVDTYKALYAEGGASAIATGLYGSYTSNFVYALPTDIIKFVSYELISSSVFKTEEGAKIDGIQAAITGAMAGLISQISTSPLDVARTRIMSEPSNKQDYSDKVEKQGQELGTRVGTDEDQTNPRSSNPVTVMGRVLKEEGPAALFAGSLPRAARAIGSGAIQFAAYELTQNSFR